MGSFVNERNYVVLESINSNLSELASLFSHLPCFTQFKSLRRRIFSRILSEVGWDKKEEENHTQSLLRNMLIGTLGKSDDQEVISKCGELFNTHSSGGDPIPADIRGSVYSTVMRGSTDPDKTYNELLDLFNKTDLHEERVRIQSVLGAAPTAELRRKTLDFAVSDKVRSNDTPFVIGAVSHSGWKGREETWQFVKNNYPLWLERYTGGFLFKRLIGDCCSSFTNMKMYEDVKEFFLTNKAPAAERTVQQSLESIKLRSDWLDRDGEAVAVWLEQNIEKK